MWNCTAQHRGQKFWPIECAKSKQEMWRALSLTQIALLRKTFSFAITQVQMTWTELAGFFHLSGLSLGWTWFGGSSTTISLGTVPNCIIYYLYITRSFLFLYYGNGFLSLTRNDLVHLVYYTYYPIMRGQFFSAQTIYEVKVLRI